MTDGLSDDEIEQRLRAAPEERWQEVWEAIAELDDEPEPGRWAGGEQLRTITVDGVEQPIIQMPYVIYGASVERIIAAIYRLGASEPFDWPAWGGLARYPSGRGLETAAVAEAVRLVTAISRADRFSEGTLLASVEDGTFRAIVDRLRRWYDEER
ncbi:MAG: DUF6508 domain-containing protein [Actinomycetota bacterium]|nr:DUF6508 domain-containing protein [Actinomycetota bacterium]